MAVSSKISQSQSTTLTDLREESEGHGFMFLAHKQLHEVLFSFLATEDIFSCRAVHSECDNVVVHYAQTQLQHVLGQDLTIETPCSSVDHRLIVLLKTRGDSIKEILLDSAGVVRSFSAQVFRGENIGRAIRALSEVMVEDVALLRGLRYVDFTGLSGSVSDDFVDLVATHSHELRFLNLKGLRMRNACPTVDSNCPMLVN